MKKQGGPGRLRQACQERRCQALQRLAATALNNKKVRERWSMLPQGSDSGRANSDGEQQTLPPATVTGRRRLGNHRRPTPTTATGEESDSDEGESPGTTTGPAAGRTTTAVRRPGCSRQLLLSVTKDMEPELIRNLAELSSGQEEEKKRNFAVAASRRQASPVLPRFPSAAVSTPPLAGMKPDTKLLER